MDSGVYQVRNWERFQHYKNRRPPWIKYHVSLLDDYELTTLPLPAQLLYDRLLLCAAKTENQIPVDLSWISQTTRLSRAIVKANLEPLLASGFLAWRKHLASTPLAECYSQAEAEAEKEVVLAERSVTSLPIDKELSTARLLEVIGPHADGKTPDQVRALATLLPQGSIVKVCESVGRAGVKNRAAYAVMALQSEIEEQRCAG